VFINGNLLLRLAKSSMAISSTSPSIAAS
jgi:hypothetical protein